MWRIRRMIHWFKYSNPWIKFKKYIRYSTFDDIEVWNLSDHTAMYMLPRLKALRNGHRGYPATLHDDNDIANKQWEEILDDIIIALELQISEDRCYYGEKAAEDRMIMEHGFNLMAKYWLNLWD